jgi:hypothetical protein
MSEKELGRALLELDSQKLAGAGDVQQQTWKILEADRRRVWWWTAITISLWAVALLMVLWMLVAFGLLFPFQAHLAQDDQLARIGIDPAMRDKALLKAQIMFQMITVGVTVSLGVTCLAILSSILLNRASRRATLRQINASLLEISNQLKELRQSSPLPTQKVQ